jgi:tRNA 2-thiouridine synthesizing protein E
LVKPVSKIVLADGSSLDLDEKGYLLNPALWTDEVSRIMAAADGLELKPDHWAVLLIFRDYFERFDIDPPMRALVRAAREQLGEAKGNSRYLYQLFPAGPAIQACRYAGLPRPISCI